MTDKKTNLELIQAARQQASKPDIQASCSNFDDFGESLWVDKSGPDETKPGSLSTDEEEAIPQGSTINRYRIVKKVGEGGMGEVYLAHHVRFTKRLFAIKFLKSGLVTPSMRDRFESEINAMENLEHPNIVYAHDAGEFEGMTYLVMDFVEGMSFKAIVGDGLPASTANIADLIRQAALGLQHAHEQGMVHRDIKPSNLMLSKEGVVKILDLGLAKIRDQDGKQLTMTQQILGTPDYMAPEQWQDTKAVDIRADIYSLGCTLYCLLTGRPPFDDEKHGSLATKLSAHLSEPPPSLDPKVIEQVPEELRQVLNRMLEKNPDDRFQTPEEIAAILQPLATGADLSQLTSRIDTSEYADAITRSINDALEETNSFQGEKETERDFEKSVVSNTPGFGLRNFLVYCSIGIPVGVLLVMGVLFAMNGGAGKNGDSIAQNNSGLQSDSKNGEADETVQNSEQGKAGLPVKPVSTNPISVSYFARENRNLAFNDEQQPSITPLGEIGSNVPSVSYGDGLKLDVRLKGPKFCYLFALNPTTDPKWRIQLCYPETEDAFPEQNDGFQYPPSDSGYFPLTDGVGQVAFVLVESDLPLPAFADWKSQFIGDDFPWKVSKQTGVWEMKDDQLSRVFLDAKSEFATRGATVKIESRTLEESMNRLRSDKHRLSVLAFSVTE